MRHSLFFEKFKEKSPSDHSSFKKFVNHPCAASNDMTVATSQKSLTVKTLENSAGNLPLEAAANLHNASSCSPFEKASIAESSEHFPESRV